MSLGRSRRVLAGLAIGGLLLASPATAGKPAPRAQRSIGEPPQAHWRDDDSRRAEAIRRARDEIRRTPGQKKFILFRYGLREEDVR